MIIYDISKNALKPEAGDNQQIPASKIIDFFAAREALHAEAKSLAQIMMHQARYRAARRLRQEVHLFDLAEDFLFLVLIAAAILGLLAIAGLDEDRLNGGRITHAAAYARQHKEAQKPEASSENQEVQRQFRIRKPVPCISINLVRTSKPGIDLKREQTSKFLLPASPPKLLLV